jgi:HSP20 family protein
MITDFFDDSWTKNRFIGMDWSPAINVVDNEGNYQIEVAAPGFKKDDFKVTVEKGLLMIKGEWKFEKEEEEKNYTRKEFAHRSFTKSFTLPENVKTDDLEAIYKDGILRLTLMKIEKALPPKKEIAIK